MGNGHITAKQILRVPKEGEVVGIPPSRNFVTPTEFAEHVGESRENIAKKMKRGQIRTEPHPTRPRRKVIPVGELKRILLTNTGPMIPYRGREYPHQFYLFFLFASLGQNYDAVKDDLDRLDLIVPPQHELEEMYHAIYQTAPPMVQRRMRLSKDHALCRDFDDWIKWLEFSELYEDLYGYVPYAIMGDTGLRFMIEIMSTANFKPYEAANAIEEARDLRIDPSVIRNYVLIFHYIRHLRNEDWELYLDNIGAKTTTSKAMVRGNCVDSKLNVYKELMLKGKLSKMDELDDAWYKSKWAYNKLLERDDIEYLSASVNQLRGMKLADDMIRAHEESKKKKEDEAQANIEERRKLATGESKVNIANMEERSAEDDDKLLEEIVAEDEIEDLKSSG